MGDLMESILHLEYHQACHQSKEDQNLHLHNIPCHRIQDYRILKMLCLYLTNRLLESNLGNISCIGLLWN